jgi:N-acetylglucosaminyldiphosphoundecaprenol N-acetyl-beta-D-mannosaminyltransferase
MAGIDAILASQILGINVARLTVEQFIERVVAAARERQRWRVCYVNAANFNLAANDNRYAEVLRAADVVYADGQAVVWASRCLGCPLPERVNAGDFFDRFCEACARENLSLYFLGSRPGVARQAAQNIVKRIGNLRIVGTRDGYFELAQSADVVAEINRLAPDILIVGMGAPRQEFWVAEQHGNLNVGVAWCVGALFEYVAGETLRAPVWMRKAGLEWVFRLVLEPRRLWRRYLVGNWIFLWRVLRARRSTAQRS